MSAFRITATVLMVAGALSLYFGASSYAKESHKARVAALELTVMDRETVDLPVWVGVVALVAGGHMLGAPKRRS